MTIESMAESVDGRMTIAAEPQQVSRDRTEHLQTPPLNRQLIDFR